MVFKQKITYFSHSGAPRISDYFIFGKPILKILKKAPQPQ